MPEHTPAPTPIRAVYGFVMYLSFQIFFIIYLIWALVPEEYFTWIGITFLPQRYWAITVPIYSLTVLTLFAFIIYPSLGLCMTPDLDDWRTIRDKVGSRRKKNGEKFIGEMSETSAGCICENKDKCFKEFYEKVKISTVDKKIPKLYDLDMWDVSEHLYLKKLN